MGNVVAIDAGTTGVRALVVDEQARVVDVAYREITQYFPRPGWVEHDPVEIWDAVCATLAEVGDRLAEAGGTVAAIGITNQRETLVAFDRADGRPLHRAIVWQDRRTADICAALEHGGHLPMVRERTGLILDPYFTATKITWLLRHGDLALSARSPDLAFGTVDSWLLWNLTGGTDGGEFATDPSNASRTMLLDTATLAWSADLCALFSVPQHALPEVRPSAGRFGLAHLPHLGPAAAVLDGVPVSGVLGDQQAALFGQACIDPGMVKVTYGTGSFVLANAGPDRPAAPDGLTVSVAWDLGAHAGTGPVPDGGGRAEVGKLRQAEASRRRPHLGEGVRRHAEERAEVGGPGESGRIQQHGAAGVGRVRGELASPGSPGQVPEQPTVDGTEGEVRVAGGKGQISLTEEPGDLRGGEIRVEHQPRPPPHHGEVALVLERGADIGGPAVLPDDGPVQRPAVGAVEGDQRLALIGDADGRHGAPGLGEAAPDLGQRGAHGVPDLDGVVLDPSRAGEGLGDLAVGDVDDPGPLVHHQCPHAGRPGIDRHHVAHAGEASEAANPASSGVAGTGFPLGRGPLSAGPGARL